MSVSLVKLPQCARSRTRTLASAPMPASLRSSILRSLFDYSVNGKDWTKDIFSNFSARDFDLCHGHKYSAQHTKTKIRQIKTCQIGMTDASNIFLSWRFVFSINILKPWIYVPQTYLNHCISQDRLGYAERKKNESKSHRF